MVRYAFPARTCRCGQPVPRHSAGTGAHASSKPVANSPAARLVWHWLPCSRRRTASAGRETLVLTSLQSLYWLHCHPVVGNGTVVITAPPPHTHTRLCEKKCKSSIKCSDLLQVFLCKTSQIFFHFHFQHITTFFKATICLMLFLNIFSRHCEQN